MLMISDSSTSPSSSIESILPGRLVYYRIQLAGGLSECVFIETIGFIEGRADSCRRGSEAQLPSKQVVSISLTYTTGVMSFPLMKVMPKASIFRILVDIILYSVKFLAACFNIFRTRWEMPSRSMRKQVSKSGFSSWIPSSSGEN